MKTWNERLQHAIKLSDMNKGQFAKAVKVSSPTVTDWTKGEIKELKAENASKIADVLGIRIDWLLFGKGDMYSASYQEASSSSIRASGKPDLVEYTIETAPVCTTDYILFIEGNTAVDYEDDARFHCVPYEGEATWKARFLLFRKPGDTIPVLGEQHGSRHRKTHLSELVGGRRVDHPDLLHPLDSVEVLCAIRDVVTDSGLWDDG